MREVSFPIPTSYHGILDRLVEAGVEEIELCATPEWDILYPQVRDAYPATIHQQIQQLCTELLKITKALELDVQGICIQAMHKRFFCYQ